MNEKPTEEIKKLPIITKFCMTIGQLPTSYLMSMTYLEQVTWLCNFLEKEMIPALNQNAAAVKELQTLFELLRTYVNNYFDNLDVQDEINNKLDQMLEDGVLEQIIEQYINSTAIWSFDSVASMKESTNLINGSYAKTLGYYNVNDGGSALYKITDTLSVNDYQETLESGLYATLIIDDKLDIRKIGCMGNVLEDSTTKLQIAINLCEYYNIPLYLPNGTYNTTDILGYTSSTSNYSLLVNKSLTIIGEDKYKTIIRSVKQNLTTADGTKIGYCTPLFINPNVNNIIIDFENFTIDGSTNVSLVRSNFNKNHKAICFLNSNNSIEDIIIKNLNIKNLEGEGLWCANTNINRTLVENCDFYNTNGAGGNMSGRTTYRNCHFKECFSIEHSNKADNGYLIVDSCHFLNGCYDTISCIATQFEYDKATLTESDCNYIKTGKVEIFNSIFEITEDWYNSQNLYPNISLYEIGNSFIHDNTFINCGKGISNSYFAIRVREHCGNVNISDNTFINTINSNNIANGIGITGNNSQYIKRNIVLSNNTQYMNSPTLRNLLLSAKNFTDGTIVNSQNNLLIYSSKFNSTQQFLTMNFITTKPNQIEASVNIITEASTRLQMLNRSSSAISELLPTTTLSEGKYKYYSDFVVPFNSSNNLDIEVASLNYIGSEDNDFTIKITY